MAKQLTLNTGMIITVSDTPFASGGEGDLYSINSPATLSRSVVKIYKTHKQTQERHEKIVYLVNNPPQGLIGINQHSSVCWMTHVVYEQTQFVGFVMPKVEGVSLELLCHTSLKNPKLSSNIWQRFSLDTQEGLQCRLKLCFNIAVALQHIHAHGCYTVVDMKPDNIMIQPDGLVSLIDIDSIDVLDNTHKSVYPALVITPDYAPPEYHYSNSLATVNQAWDNFSIAVIYYRLLCGIHPFVGTCYPPYDNHCELPQRIQNGLVPMGEYIKYFSVIPPPHSHFYKLDQALQKLFIQCFTDGHHHPDVRPKVEKWCAILQVSVLNSPVVVKNIPTPSVTTPPNIAAKKPIPSYKKRIIEIFFTILIIVFLSYHLRANWYKPVVTVDQSPRDTHPIVFKIPDPSLSIDQTSRNTSPIASMKTAPAKKEININEIHDCLLNGNCNNTAHSKK